MDNIYNDQNNAYLQCQIVKALRDERQIFVDNKDYKAAKKITNRIKKHAEACVLCRASLERIRQYNNLYWNCIMENGDTQEKNQPYLEADPVSLIKDNKKHIN